METTKIEFTLDPYEFKTFSDVPEIKEKEAKGWTVEMIKLCPVGDKAFRAVVTFAREAGSPENQDAPEAIRPSALTSPYR